MLLLDSEFGEEDEADEHMTAMPRVVVKRNKRNTPSHSIIHADNKALFMPRNKTTITNSCSHCFFYFKLTSLTVFPSILFAFKDTVELQSHQMAPW
eukprot:m.97122 g.97122  ORF g.97122 m.97122 type:complete len:96 (+) comp12485_c0_seq4:1772-2059(+)